MSSQLVQFFGKALVPIAVFGGLALFRKYFRSSLPKAPGRNVSMEELDNRFQSTKWIAAFCMVLVGTIFVWSTHEALVWLNRHLAAADGSAEFTFLSQSAIWWFFPAFGALTLSWEITLQLWSLFGSREEADLFSDWSNNTTTFWSNGRYSGMDSRKVLRWMALVVALPVGIFSFLDVSEHTLLQENEIRECGFRFKPCKVYAYEDARRMTEIRGLRERDGKLTPRAGIVIDFGDGRRWSSADTGDFRKSLDPALEEFLKRKTGLPLGSAETESDIPPLGG